MCRKCQCAHIVRREEEMVLTILTVLCGKERGEQKIVGLPHRDKAVGCKLKRCWRACAWTQGPASRLWPQSATHGPLQGFAG